MTSISKLFDDIDFDAMAGTIPVPAQTQVSTALVSAIVQINKAFGIPCDDSEVLPGYQPNDRPETPELEEEHVFTRDFLRKVFNYVRNPRRDAMWVYGPMGSGKTSGIAQVAARINMPLFSYCADGRTTLRDLIGGMGLVAGDTRFQYGPLAQAYRDGMWFVLEEADLVDPDQMAGLNNILERRPLVLGENGGEVIKCHANFRFFLTANTAGSGDTAKAYRGVKRQNVALMDRMRFVKVWYMTSEEEATLLAGKVPMLTRSQAERLVEVANAIRDLYIGPSKQGLDGVIHCPMSTRVLVRWAELASDFAAPSIRVGLAQMGLTPLSYTLPMAFLDRFIPEEREAIEQICLSILDKEWKP